MRKLTSVFHIDMLKSKEKENLIYKIYLKSDIT